MNNDDKLMKLRMRTCLINIHCLFHEEWQENVFDTSTFLSMLVKYGICGIGIKSFSQEENLLLLLLSYDLY